MPEALPGSNTFNPSTLVATLGRWDGCGTFSRTDEKSKSLGKYGSGTVGRMYTPKPPPADLKFNVQGSRFEVGC